MDIVDVGQHRPDPCDVLVLVAGKQWRDRPDLRHWDQTSGGWLGRLLDSQQISTSLFATSLHHFPPQLPCNALLIAGIDTASMEEEGVAFRLGAAVAKSIGSKPRNSVRLSGFPASQEAKEAAVAGLMNGPVGQDLFRAEKSLTPPKTFFWEGLGESALHRGKIIGEAMLAARRWINLPPNYLYPESFAKEIVEMASTSGLEVEVWDRKRLEQERCHALLAVGRGSSREPRLLILRHRGNATGSAPTALVGKGVTFDSGGLSIKPTDGMLTMKGDMAGAATVVGILQAAAKLKIRQPVVGLVGLVENMLGDDCYKLGDVIQARSGKSIEIHNTDAEGRVVLADCLNVALDSKPARIVDFATLTGACVVALGNDIAGLFSNSDLLTSQIQQAAQRAGEYVWPMPMHSFFRDQIVGKVGDIKNVGEGRWGGAITAAKFLEEFVAGKPWAHLDIAGPAFAGSPCAWMDAGGSGFAIRSMLHFLEGLSDD
ncbi:MAG: leucyl aminopeptidase family protein [Pirellulaceae bacterium]|jgi:leucyl aminopeptidase